MPVTMSVVLASLLICFFPSSSLSISSERKNEMTAKVLHQVLQALNMQKALGLTNIQKEKVDNYRKTLEEKMKMSSQELDNFYSNGARKSDVPDNVFQSSSGINQRAFTQPHEKKLKEIFFLKPNKIHASIKWTEKNNKAIKENYIFNKLSRKISINFQDILNEEDVENRLEEVKFHLDLNINGSIVEDHCIWVYKIDKKSLSVNVASKPLAFATHTYSYENEPIELLFHNDATAKKTVIDLWERNEADLKLAILVIKKNGRSCSETNRPINEIEPVVFHLRYLNGNSTYSLFSKYTEVVLNEPHEHIRQKRHVHDLGIIKSRSVDFVETPDEILTGRDVQKRRRRDKRETGCNTLSSCCIQPLKLNFEEIGWDYIIAPKSFQANSCDGICSLEAASATADKGRLFIPTVKMCCVPTIMETMTILYITSSDNLSLKHVSNIKASVCGCR